jgi:hypothetical protein
MSSMMDKQTSVFLHELSAQFEPIDAVPVRSAEVRVRTCMIFVR